MTHRFIPATAMLALFAAILLAAGCANINGPSAPPGERLPPVSTEASGTWLPGKFVWHDLVTPDAAASREFYGKLFGWTFEPHERYTEIFHHGRRIGGMVELPVNRERPAAAEWLASMSVTDVDRAAELVTSRGGTILSGPADMPDRGRGVLIRDPQGGHLVLLHSRVGDPPDRRPDLNEWLWNEYWTRDLADTVAWYRPLGEYDATLPGKKYVILIREGRWRAGIRDVGDSDFHGRGVPVVRVGDPAALIDKAEQLGGTIWVRPGEHENNPDVALISDNAGALLMLQRWTFGDEGDAK